MYILWMYYISLLLLPPDGFVLCYIGLLVLTLWRFDDDVISPSPGTGRYIHLSHPKDSITLFKEIRSAQLDLLICSEIRSLAPSASQPSQAAPRSGPIFFYMYIYLFIYIYI